MQVSVSYIKLYVTAVWPLPHLTGDINVSSIPEFQDWLKELDEQAFRSDPVTEPCIPGCQGGP